MANYNPPQQIPTGVFPNRMNGGIQYMVRPPRSGSCSLKRQANKRRGRWRYASKRHVAGLPADVVTQRTTLCNQIRAACTANREYSHNGINYRVGVRGGIARQNRAGTRYYNVRWGSLPAAALADGKARYRYIQNPTLYNWGSGQGAVVPNGVGNGNRYNGVFAGAGRWGGAGGNGGGYSFYNGRAAGVGNAYAGGNNATYGAARGGGAHGDRGDDDDRFEPDREDGDGFEPDREDDDGFEPDIGPEPEAEPGPPGVDPVIAEAKIAIDNMNPDGSSSS